MEENVVKPPEENALHDSQSKLGKIAELLVTTLHYATTSTEFAYLTDLINEYIEENRGKSTELLFFIHQASVALSQKLKKGKKTSDKSDALIITKDLRVNLPSAALLLQASEEEARLHNKNIADTTARSLIQAVIKADILLDSEIIYKNLSLLGKLIIEGKDYEHIKDLKQTREYTSAIKHALNKIKIQQKAEYIHPYSKYDAGGSDGGGKIDESAEKTKSLIHTLRTQTNSSSGRQKHIHKQISSTPIGLK